MTKDLIRVGRPFQIKYRFRTVLSIRHHAGSPLPPAEDHERNLLCPTTYSTHQFHMKSIQQQSLSQHVLYCLENSVSGCTLLIFSKLVYFVACGLSSFEYL